MTSEQVEQAIKDVDCGFDVATGGFVDVEVATTGYCNAFTCSALAVRATAAGLDATDIGEAVRELVDGDDTAMRVILSP